MLPSFFAFISAVYDTVILLFILFMRLSTGNMLQGVFYLNSEIACKNYTSHLKMFLIPKQNPHKMQLSAKDIQIYLFQIPL